MLSTMVLLSTMANPVSEPDPQFISGGLIGVGIPFGGHRGRYGYGYYGPRYPYYGGGFYPRYPYPYYGRIYGYGPYY